MNVAAVVMFAFVSSITPGPNNVMLWASGMNFGFVRTLPHMAGIVLGWSALLFSASVGLGAVFTAYPALNWILRIVASIYLLYLAYRVATSTGEPHEGKVAKPLSFWEASAFQFVNPKGFTMALSAASAFLATDLPLLWAAAALTGLCALVSIPCIMTWAAAGTAIGRLLTNKRRRRVVNVFLALLLVGTIVLINL